MRAFRARDSGTAAGCLHRPNQSFRHRTHIAFRPSLHFTNVCRRRQLCTKSDCERQVSKAMFIYLYFVLGRGAKYWDRRACMSVCLFVCLSARMTSYFHIMEQIGRIRDDKYVSRSSEGGVSGAKSGLSAGILLKLCYVMTAE